MSWFVEENMGWSQTYDKRSTWTVELPESQVGEHSIIHYTPENESDWHPYFEKYIRAKKESPHLKKYTTLLRNNHWITIMQDSFTEFEEHQWLWGHATGDILVTGLGIGFVNEWLIKAPGVKSVTIIEKNQDVIDMVWDHCAKDERFTLIHADADNWEIPEDSSWDCIWIDHEISSPTHITEITAKYQPYTNNLGFYGQFKNLDNYYEIDVDSGMLAVRDPNQKLEWM